MKPYEISGTYGMSRKNECTIFVYPQRRGGAWYVIEDSENINFTYDELTDGVDAEEINDIDTMNANCPVESLDQLIEEVDE
jgi:hypothetical protein